MSSCGRDGDPTTDNHKKPPIPFFLFGVDHTGSSPIGDARIPGSWDIFLNVLNVETEDGATGGHLRRVFYGEPEPGFDAMMSGLYIQCCDPR